MPADPPLDENGLFARLRGLGIAFENREHAPLRTVAESRALRGTIPGAHVKNLFLRDKKRRFFLVTVGEERTVDLRALRRAVGARGNLSFGDEAALRGRLGVAPGAVTPFAVANDPEGLVTMVLERALAGAGLVSAHPLRNDMTTTLAAADLLRFLEAEGHPPLLVDLPGSPG